MTGGVLSISEVSSSTEINDLATQVTTLREVTKGYMTTKWNLFEFSGHTRMD
jgi:hypothetical protein